MQHDITKAPFLVYIDNFLRNLYVATFLLLEILWNCFNWGSQTKIYDTLHEDGDQEEEEKEQEVVGQ